MRLGSILEMTASSIPIPNHNRIICKRQKNPMLRRNSKGVLSTGAQNEEISFLQNPCMVGFFLLKTR